MPTSLPAAVSSACEKAGGHHKKTSNGVDIAVLSALVGVIMGGFTLRRKVGHSHCLCRVMFQSILVKVTSVTGPEIKHRNHPRPKGGKGHQGNGIVQVWNLLGTQE